MRRAGCIIGLLLIVFGIGLITGRLTRTAEPVIDYVPLPSVEGHVPSKTLVPKDIEYRDTIIYRWVYLPGPGITPENHTKIESNGQIDTLPQPGIDSLQSIRATVEDWNAKRTYEQTLFDRADLGRITVHATVQYNELRQLSYNYEPVQKEVTYIKQPVIQPFIRASYNTRETMTIGGGLYIKNVGLDVHYVRDGSNSKSGVGFGFSYRF